jgi:effector-binding domain-containing protein
MALGANTLVVPVNSVNKTLKRINQDQYSTTYYLHEASEEFTVNIRHSKESPQKDGTVFDRHNVELIHTVFATGSDPAYTRVVYIVARNTRSDDYTEVGYDIAAVADIIKASGNIADLLAWVS